MARISWPCRLALVLGGVFGTLVVQADPPRDPPAHSLIYSPILRPQQKGPVPFSHARHERAKVACTACHHEYRGRRNVWRPGQPVQKCEACHLAAPRANRLDLKNAFHRQCKTCHGQRRAGGRPAGPLKCADCHRAS